MKCTDCGVDLVSSLPPDDAAPVDDVPTNSEGLELLWRGVNEQLCNRIHYALDVAHIFHKFTDRGLGFLPAFPNSVGFIWINPKDRAAARAILENVLDDPETVDSQLQDELVAESARINPLGLGRRVFNRVADRESEDTEDEPQGSEDHDEPTPDDIVENFDPDDATADVWSGDDKDLANYINLALKGVGIGCLLHQDAGQAHVFVLPAQEKRAREIVREVIEGTPPQ